MPSRTLITTTQERAACGATALHLRAQLAGQLVTAAFQQAYGIANVTGVVRLADQPHTGRRAALDLVLQTGPVTVCKEGVAARPQAEQFLQGIDRLAHAGGAGERPEVAVRAPFLAAVVTDTRKRVGGEADIGIAFVVAVDDVVARVLLLDERGFQDQRFILGVGHRDLDTPDLADHALDARITAGTQEVLPHPLAQVARLAHVQQLAGTAKHAVHPRLRGELLQEAA
jgi:hypothetical protein